MRESSSKISRRDFFKAGAAVAGLTIVPRFVLGGAGYMPPSDKISIGFIGCGRQAQGLRGRFLALADVQVVGASDVYAAKLTHFVDAANAHYATKTGQAGYKSVKGYADFRELLAKKDIDAVVIASPDHWHAAMAVRAAEAGKDVYCEKPLSLTVEEGRAMVKAARKYKRVFQTGSMQRSSKEFIQAVQLVRSGAIGEIKKVYVNVGGPPVAWDLKAETVPDGLDWDKWMGPNTGDRPYNNELAPAMDAKFWPKWRNYREFGGGGMTDWGAHMFDIAQWGLGMDDSGPTDLIYSEPDQGLVFKYANGTEVVHRPMEGKQHCHFIGADGEIRVARGELNTTPHIYKDKIFAPDEYKIYVSNNHYEDFITAVKKRTKPVCDVEVGHRTASVCNIGNIAYQLGRSLRWDPVKERFTGDEEASKLLGRPMRKEWKV